MVVEIVMTLVLSQTTLAAFIYAAASALKVTQADSLRQPASQPAAGKQAEPTD